MKNVLILHGTNATHASNWFPWLEKELKLQGYNVWVPDLPHPDEKHFTVAEYKDYILSNWRFDSNSVLIGHSGGSVVILNILESLPKDLVVRKVILISGYTDSQGWPALKEYFSSKHNWETIKSHAKEIILINSDNDPYMSTTHGKISQERLGAKLIVVHGAGHFNLETSPKFKRFPELLKLI